MTVEAYYKLLPYALGSYGVILTTSHITTISQDEIQNTISSDRAVLAPNSMQPQDDTVGDEYEAPSSNTPNSNPADVNDQPGWGANEGSTTQEYTVDHTMKHVGKGPQRKYFGPWHGYTSQANKIEQP